MILTWMAYAMLCAGACAVAGICADTALRHRVQQRRVVWVASMLASVVLPLGIPLLAPSSNRAADIVSVVAQQPVDDEAQGLIAQTPSRVDWGQLAIVLWSMMSASLAGSLIVSNTQLRRRLRRFPRTHIDGQSLLISDDFGPAVVGLLHSTIVLPAWALKLADAEQHLVVSHELEHQRARDPVVTIAALCLVALFPWNLALWWQLSRLRLAIEFDCDARVVRRCGADPLAYGNLLLTAHENAGQSRLAVLALAPMHSALGQRVNALVVRGVQSKRRVFGATGVAALALIALGFAPVPRLPKQTTRASATLPFDGELRMTPPSAAPNELRLVETPQARSDSETHAPSDRDRRSTQGGKGRVSTYSLKPRSAATDAEASVDGASRDGVLRDGASRNGVLRQISAGTATLRAAQDSSGAPTAPTSGGAYRKDAGGTFGLAENQMAKQVDLGITSPGSSTGAAGLVRRDASATGAVMNVAPGGGGRGGSVIMSQGPPLKRFKGGFMDAEVPARPDTNSPPPR